ADEIERRNRLLVAPCAGAKRAGERDVVDVMTGREGERAFLPPARHSTVNQARVSLQADVGPETDSLHHARPESLGQCVRPIDEPEDRLHPLRVLQVHSDRATAAEQYAGAASLARDLEP